MSFQVSPPQGVVRTMLSSALSGVQQHVRGGADQGGSLEPWCPGLDRDQSLGLLPSVRQVQCEPRPLASHC